MRNGHGGTIARHQKENIETKYCIAVTETSMTPVAGIKVGKHSWLILVWNDAQFPAHYPTHCLQVTGDILCTENGATQI